MVILVQNPYIILVPSIVEPPNVLNLPNISESVLEMIDEIRSEAGEFILFNGLNQTTCNSINDVTEENDAPVFGRLPDGSWLQWEPRLVLEENTVEAPIDDGGKIHSVVFELHARCNCLHSCTVYQEGWLRC